MMLLINPRNGDAVNATTAAEFRALVLDGFKPIGPNGQAAAARILAALAEIKLEG